MKEKNRFKAVLIDLDGTLLTDEKEITDYSAQILEQLQKDGVQVIIATGRGLSRAKQLTHKLKFMPIILANNGATISSGFDISDVEDLSVDYKVVKKLSEKSHDYGIKPYFFVKDKLIIQDGLDKKDFIDSVAKIDEIMTVSEKKSDMTDVVSMVMIGNKNKIFQLIDLLKEDKNVNYHIHTKYFSPNVRMLEVQNAKTDKFKRALTILNHLGIKKEEVVSIGDAHNDLEMIVGSGLGVAMKNSDDILKQNSDVITRYTNQEDGLAKFLKELFELRDYE